MLTQSGGVAVQNWKVIPATTGYTTFQTHDTFASDHWACTWASAAADWYPAFTPEEYVTPLGDMHDLVGAAAPLPTDAPGLYWHKGGHFHDVRVTIPFTADSFAGQCLYLAHDYQVRPGYRLQLDKLHGGGVVRLFRTDQQLGEYAFPLPPLANLVLERRGAYLLIILVTLQREDGLEAEVTARKVLGAYHDDNPLPAEMVGFTVTSPQLPAESVQVDSDRIRETFEESPVGWTVQSGVWAVMSHYTCQPQWNWFGGFGAGTPTLWSKYRLDGDQVFEAYLGIKMEVDDVPEAYERRYRDVNVTICADGQHLNSGYSLIRAGRPNGVPTTLFLRQNKLVWSSTDAGDLIPSQIKGHRQWFATRLEKRGAEIKVFLDNRLAFTYVDPQPLSGGYAGVWTVNNGIMLARANLSAAHMRLVSPRKALPVITQKTLPPLPVPKITIDHLPCDPCTFEEGLDGWCERPGCSGQLVRQREMLPDGEVNTFLAVVNSYPAGDCAATMLATPFDLSHRPLLQLDYCFDTGVQVNLYLRWQETWYEVRLTGGVSEDSTIIPAGQASAVADGRWHHLAVNLGALVLEAIERQAKTPVPEDLLVQEMVVADWTTTTLARQYGFGRNPGGVTLRFDNMILLPEGSGPFSLGWHWPTGLTTTWRIATDEHPMAQPTTLTHIASLKAPVTDKRQYCHLQGKLPDGSWGGVINLPLYRLY